MSNTPRNLSGFDVLLAALAASAEHDALQTMPKTTMQHALWWFGDRELGLQPGGRDEKLLELLSVGDDETIDALLLCEPFADLVCAWLIAREEGGLDKVRRRVREIEAERANAFGMPEPRA